VAEHKYMQKGFIEETQNNKTEDSIKIDWS
jgi:hypothetical protein